MKQIWNQTNTRAAKSGMENSPNSSSFDFELWAKQVRPQLLAALNKRK